MKIFLFLFLFFFFTHEQAMCTAIGSYPARASGPGAAVSPPEAPAAAAGPSPAAHAHTRLSPDPPLLLPQKHHPDRHSPLSWTGAGPSDAQTTATPSRRRPCWPGGLEGCAPGSPSDRRFVPPEQQPGTPRPSAPHSRAVSTGCPDRLLVEDRLYASSSSSSSSSTTSPVPRKLSEQGGPGV